MKLLHILVLIIVLLLVGCAKQAPVEEPVVEEPVVEAPVEEPVVEAPVEEPVEAAAPEGEIIVIGESAPQPADVTIAAGGEVTFKNGAESRPRIIIIDELKERSPRLEPGDAHSIVFETAGEYAYRDLFQGSVRGTITVE